MLPFGIGFGEILAIFLVLIIFVGPEGIPQAVRAIAKVIKSIRSFVDEVRYSEEFDEVKREILDPLDEARRFNPKARTREWVRREIEDPIKSSLTDEPVQDFDHSPHHLQSTDHDLDHIVTQERQLSVSQDETRHRDEHQDETLSTHDEVVDEDEYTSESKPLMTTSTLDDRSPETEITASKSSDVTDTNANADDYANNNNDGDDDGDDDDDDDDDDDMPSAVSAIDPLDRNLVRPSQPH